MDRNLSIKHFTYFVAVSTLFVSAGTHSLADVKVVSQITVTGELNTGTREKLTPQIPLPIGETTTFFHGENAGFTLYFQ